MKMLNIYIRTGYLIFLRTAIMNLKNRPDTQRESDAVSKTCPTWGLKFELAIKGEAISTWVACLFRSKVQLLSLDLME
jgi:hypothetical protein